MVHNEVGAAVERLLTPRYLSYVYVRLHRNKRISEWGQSHSQDKGGSGHHTSSPLSQTQAREMVFHFRYSLETITLYFHHGFRLIVFAWPSLGLLSTWQAHLVSFCDRCRFQVTRRTIDRWGVIVKWLGSPRRVRDKHIAHAGIRKTVSHDLHVSQPTPN